MRVFRRILYAADFSRVSRRAFREAVRLATANRAELIVLHVMEPTHQVVEDYAAAARIQERRPDAKRTAAEKRVAALARTAKRAGMKVTPRVVGGDPPQVIAAEAKRSRSDLIVVGTHGRSGLKKLLIGSVAAKVVATAQCPVLTVRGQ